ncbi:MAG: proton-conducting transporter membrane subunit [Phycisphaerales bacterium]|jgi:multicomponent Na+:H+ antiporter subunit D
MNLTIIAPILIPLATTVLCIGLWKDRVMQRWVSVAGAVSLLASSLSLLYATSDGTVVTTNAAGWAAPFGISLVADTLSAMLVGLTGVIAVAITVYSLGAIDRKRESFGYHPLMHAVLAACSGAFLTGDVFNMYVWFEIMLLASFVLLTLGGERGQLEGAIKYVTLNLLSSGIFLAAIGLLYGMTGTLNMAHLSIVLERADNPGAITALSMLFLVAFGIKAAVFPLFFWLPASYHTPPVAITALFAALLTKVGVYSIMRTFTLLFDQQLEITAPILMWISGLTMVTGVLGAACQFEIRRILAFHSVSQIGYMLMGLSVALYALAHAEPDSAGARETATVALAGSAMFLLHHGIVKGNLFLISGLVQRIAGTSELQHLGGLVKTHPWTGVLFMASAMSLAGIPISTGFWGKFVLIKSGLAAGAFALVAASLCVSILTLYSMTKIWAEAFWKEPPESMPEPPRVSGKSDRVRIGLMAAPIIVLATATIALGVLIEPLYRVAERAGEQLLDTEGYQRAVLGEYYQRAVDGTLHELDTVPSAADAPQEDQP